MALGPEALVEPLSPTVVERRRPAEQLGAPLAGDLRGGLDEPPPSERPRASSAAKRSFNTTVSRGSIELKDQYIVAWPHARPSPSPSRATSISPPSPGARKRRKKRRARSPSGRSTS
jgi:hypothetical protein